jgi:hypothetical protein
MPDYRPECIDCRYYLNNGVAHCVNPKVARAVRLIVGDLAEREAGMPVHEMQIHFIRFTREFCGVDGDWFEPKAVLYDRDKDRD